MSRIPDLGDKLELLPDLLAEYENDLKSVEKDLQIEGKRLEVANREQASLQNYYDSRKVELKTLVEFMDLKVKAVQSRLFKSYTESYSVALSDRAKYTYIEHEKEYLEKYELYLEVKEVYEHYVAAVEAFQARAYALNNITKIRVASLEDITI